MAFKCNQPSYDGIINSIRIKTEDREEVGGASMVCKELKLSLDYRPNSNLFPPENTCFSSN